LLARSLWRGIWACPRGGNWWEYVIWNLVQTSF
jgi:hypothetical protein